MELELKLNSLYICVKNMERAINFYEEFFTQKVEVKDEIFSVFDLNGFRFCLFNNAKVNEDVFWGDNCLPSFEVNNIEKLTEIHLNILKCVIYQIKQLIKVYKLATNYIQ
ncbi:Lactoylglutathione lyase (LGUL) family protein, diverged [Clostridium sp. IBUN22A]|uniref:glyoxalase/bleomycin resistance/dioxygenase family protein n=1 Tax=Clostridium sp. IBUN22A TaxID=1523155 RepID=UPI0005FAFD53|nr:glyoxalase/bleomycin resistance/dioxygenase family protein [Clostridium sp. IBUN22A]KJZ87815.1 Lactoylglutathione lyase (LGUL) family protein, diverged [Clostridium sp. IBUN22A]